MIPVVEINTLQELRPYRFVWESLFRQSTSPSFFESYEAVEAAWMNDSSETHWRILLVTLFGKPLGILPLVVKPLSTSWGDMRALSFPQGTADSSIGPLGPNPGITLFLAFRHIRQTRRDWDIFNLSSTDKEDRETNRLRNALRANGFRFHEQRGLKTSFLRLSKSDGKCRGNQVEPFLPNDYREAARLAATLGRVEYVRLRPEPRNRYQQSHWKHWRKICDEMGENNSSPPLTLSHEYVDNRAAEVGRLDLNLLFLDGQQVAFFQNYLVENTLEAGHSACALGVPQQVFTVLIGRMILDSLRRGDNGFRFRPAQIEPNTIPLSQTGTGSRFQHFPVTAARAQALRIHNGVKHWWSRQKKHSRKGPFWKRTPNRRQKSPLSVIE